jgi:hypothetical protein
MPRHFSHFNRLRSSAASVAHTHPTLLLLDHIYSPISTGQVECGICYTYSSHSSTPRSHLFSHFNRSGRVRHLLHIRPRRRHSRARVRRPAVRARLPCWLPLRVRSWSAQRSSELWHILRGVSLLQHTAHRQAAAVRQPVFGCRAFFAAKISLVFVSSYDPEKKHTYELCTPFCATLYFVSTVFVSSYDPEKKHTYELCTPFCATLYFVSTVCISSRCCVLTCINQCANIQCCTVLSDNDLHTS